MKTKFKVGDTIVPEIPHRGVEEGTVIRIDDKNYYLKILCGSAIIPIKAQEYYKLKDK